MFAEREHGRTWLEKNAVKLFAMKLALFISRQLEVRAVA
jgi:hypothetical protein